jgi:hypothetical protein
MSEWILSSSQCLRQRTFDPVGHTLNHRQVFSPTGRFAYFDSRNADTQIASTDRIGRIDLQTCEIDWLYRVQEPSPFGPGVGAVACHPERERLIFIHGLLHCGPEYPYRATRRFGAVLDVRHPASSVIEHAEARCIASAPPCGALRGGTHAHSWSADGRAISFTYNDAWVEQLHHEGSGPVDLRTVGVMYCDQPVEAASPDSSRSLSENFSGTAYAMVVAPVSSCPCPGTDAIDSAREECFLGRSRHALAFIGRVRTQQGEAIDEVFVSRWPERPVLPSGVCSIDGEGRLEVPPFVKADRVTRTEDRPFPGVSGPRAWLVAAPDGNAIYCPMRDDAGVVQVAAVDIGSGQIEYLTDLATPLESPLALDESGSQISLVSEGKIGILDLVSREIRWSPDLRGILEIPWGAIHFLPEGGGCLFHAYPRNQTQKWQQLWTLTLHW